MFTCELHIQCIKEKYLEKNTLSLEVQFHVLIYNTHLFDSSIGSLQKASLKTSTIALK